MPLDCRLVPRKTRSLERLDHGHRLPNSGEPAAVSAGEKVGEALIPEHFEPGPGPACARSAHGPY
jgi:hypothetical protein